MNQQETLKARGNLLRPPSAPKKKRKFLSRASPKREQQNKEYLKLRKEFLGAHRFCEAGVSAGLLPPPGEKCNRRPTDVHHRLGRVGKNFLDQRTWLAVCRPCHNWIHAHPAQARELGLLQ